MNAYFVQRRIWLSFMPVYCSKLPKLYNRTNNNRTEYTPLRTDYFVTAQKQFELDKISLAIRLA